MVSRFSSIFPLIVISLSIFLCVEMFWLAMTRFLFAAESGDRHLAGQVAPEPRKAAPAAGAGADYAIITDRNLFGLRPAGAGEERAAADPLAGLPETSLDLVLMGIADGGSRGSRAVILSKKDKKQQLYQVGDVVAGAQIKSILWGKVVLSANGRDEILDMSGTAIYRSRAVGVPVPAPAPVSPQEKRVASSAVSDTVNPLIPERVRLVLPDPEKAGSPSDE